MCSDFFCLFHPSMLEEENSDSSICQLSSFELGWGKNLHLNDSNSEESYNPTPSFRFTFRKKHYLMDTQKLFVSRGMPMSHAFLTGSLANSMGAGAKPMPNDLPLEPTSLLFDRFSALMKRREKQMRVSDDPYAPPTTTDEIAQLYDLVLSELTFHSKPLISDLTIIAGEQREHAKGIADAICSRIIEASPEQKLPSLYLLDSIVKIIGQEYVHYFSLHLPDVFCEAYQQVRPNLHDSMRHLFWTWSVVFPPSVLSKIEAELQFSQDVNTRSGPNEFKTSEPSRPTHGIRANRKKMQLLEHINVDCMRTEQSELLKSVRTVGHVNSIQRPEIHPHSIVRLGRPDSPSRIDPDKSSLLSFDESAVDNSSRIVRGESPSHLAFGNPISHDEELVAWRRKQFNDKNCYKLEVSTTYNLGTENEHQSPRSLVHAYGSDRRTEILGNRSLVVEQLTINAIDKTRTQTSWKNSEEEEFDWDDMSPTFMDQARNSDFLQSPHPHHSVSGCRPPFSATNESTLVLKSRKHWSSGAQLRPENDSSTIAKYGLGCRSASELPEFQTRTNQNLASHHSHDAWNSPYNESQPSRFLLHGKVGGRDLHLPPLVEKPLRANLNPYGFSEFVPSFSSCIHDPVKLNVNVQTTHLLNRNPGFQFQSHGRDQCSSMTRSPLFSNQCNGLLAVNQQNSEHDTSSQQLFFSKDEHMLNASSVVQLPTTSKYTSNNPFLLQMGALSSLPLGVTSAENQSSIQASVGIEFNSDVLKVRHESAVRSLYSDLLRQCRTCGLRFKCQGEHSSHMDWHVTKNRMSKNQKQKPSRKWFVSQGMWLSSAEAPGTDIVPGFLPPEVVVEKKENEEMAVPAEEEQNVCALCGEPFDEFYSDEMEEWMYKGAVYLHATKGSTVGVDRSQLGPIVHSKCRSHSSELSSEDFGLVEGGPVEGGSQRKKLRIN